MCTFRRIAISNRRLCPRPLPEQVRRLKGQADALILREKDLTEPEYETLAREVAKACRESGIELICHTFIQAAKNIGCPAIHLPLALLMESRGKLEGFEKVGVSVHSEEEVGLAQKEGADYVTVSPIFETDCKPGQPARGLEFLKKICEESEIQVYALGGINEENEILARRAGAVGACRMSDFMRRDL